MAKIYLSSTYEDLFECREVVYRTLRQMKHDVIAMEDYVAQDQRPLQKCLADVASSNVYIGIFAWRYGYVPRKNNPKKKSITELEYRKARKVGIPRFVFLLDDNEPWPPNLIDGTLQSNKKYGKKINTLREELKQENIVKFFKSPHELAALVSVAIQQVSKGTDDSVHPIRVSPIFAGREDPPPVETDLCTVLMPNEGLSLYRKYIKPPLENLGFRVMGPQDIFQLGETFMESLWKAINKSEFLVVDITGKHPGAFYELGIAHTLGKRTILIAQDQNDVPSDLRYLQYIIYGVDSYQGKRNLKNQIIEIARTFR